MRTRRCAGRSARWPRIPYTIEASGPAETTAFTPHAGDSATEENGEGEQGQERGRRTVAATSLRERVQRVSEKIQSNVGMAERISLVSEAYLQKELAGEAYLENKTSPARRIRKTNVASIAY